MKTTLSLILVFSTLFAISQEQNLIGTWGVTECAYVSSTGTEKIMVDEIKKGTAVTDYFIYENGIYKLTSNMAGSGTMDTYEGTWKTEGNQFITTISMENQTVELIWNYEIKDDLLILSRENPMKTMSVVNTYKRK
jgi:hypothetical protein